MAIFGPIWTQFRSKQLKIWPESHWIDRIDQKWLGSIGSIGSIESMLNKSMLISMLPVRC